MELIHRNFKKLFKLMPDYPLGNSGEILKDELTVRYITGFDANKKMIIDFIIFDRYGFPPAHRRIDSKGEIQELEKFQFSIMYESPEEREKEEKKMAKVNLKTAKSILAKGLAQDSEEWIQIYL